MERLRTLPWWLSAVRSGRIEEGTAVASARRRASRLPLLAVSVGLVLGVGLVVEARTSWLEARLFRAAAARLQYTVAPGPTPALLRAPGGPFDKQRGYTRLPAMLARLEAQGYAVVAQARSSPAAWLASRAGLLWSRDARGAAADRV